jgi:hypothetical protein
MSMCAESFWPKQKGLVKMSELPPVLAPPRAQVYVATNKEICSFHQLAKSCRSDGESEIEQPRDSLPVPDPKPRKARNLGVIRST